MRRITPAKIFLALGTAVSVLAMLGFYIAITAPARSRLDESQAIQTAEALLRPTFPRQAQADSNSAASVAPPSSHAKATKSPDTKPLLGRLSDCELPLWPRLSTLPSTDTTESFRHHPAHRYFWEMESNMQELRTEASQADQRNRVLAAAQDALKTKRYEPRGLEEDSQPSTTALSVALNTYLDSVETLLESDSWNVQLSGRTWQSPMGFCKFGWLAAARASLRGDKDRANDLFERYLEAVRLVDIGIFPYSYYGAPIENAIFQMSQITSFPREGLERAQRAIDRMEMKPEVLKALSDVCCAQYAETYNTCERQIWPYRRWHTIMGGVPEHLVNAALKPLWDREFEACRNAQRARNGVKSERALHNLEVIEELMNFSSWDGISVKNRVPLILNADRDIATRLQFDRFVVAACRYHRDTGRYPTSARDLVPTYLDPSFESTTSTTWAVYMLPAFRIPHPRAMARSKVFREAVRAYRAKYDKQHPNDDVRVLMALNGRQYDALCPTAEQLREFASTPSAYEEICSQFEEVSAAPVFCKSSPSGDPRSTERHIEGRIPCTSQSYRDFLCLLDVGPGEKKKINVQRNGRGDTIVVGSRDGRGKSELGVKK